MTGPWKDPLATFIYITCKLALFPDHCRLILKNLELVGELLIPLTPFGGFGGNRQVQFWGKRLSRNKVIAEIVTYATGVPAAQAYDHKHISSHKQTIIKSLLIRYDDEALDDQLREDAARALRQFAGATPASRFLASYLRPVNTASANIHVITQLRLRSAAQDFVAEYRSIGPVEDRERPCRNHPNVLRLHPFLALFLGLDGNSSADASRSNYMAADRALAPGQAIANFARTWWDSSVMTADADRKVVWVERWYANRELTIGRLSDEEFYNIHGEPPASNGGLVQGRFARAQQ